MYLWACIGCKNLQLSSTCAQVTCVTYGAPRTGNAAFAELFNKTVPDTWQIINVRTFC